MQELRGSHPALAWAGAGVWGAEGAGGGPGRHRTPTGHVDGGGALRRVGRRCPLAPEGARDGRSGRAACCPCPPHPLGLPRSGDTSLLPPWPPALSPSVSSAMAATASFLCLEQRPVHSECPVHVRRVSDMRSAQRWPREGFGGPFGGVSLRRGRAPTQPEGRGCTGVLPARVWPGGTGSEGPAEAPALSPGRRPALSHTRGSGSAAAGSPT